MIWTATFKDGSVEFSNDLIYHKLKDRLDDLAMITVAVGINRYNLLWQEGTFVVNGMIFSLHDKTQLTDIRPITFRRESVPFNMIQGPGNKPIVGAYGLGFQGNDVNGNNVKCHILIDMEGKFKVSM